MKLTKQQITALANEITKWCFDNHFGDVIIYYNGKRRLIDYNRKSRVEYKVDPKDYMEYTSDIITMSFEGDMYEAFNYSGVNYKAWSDDVINFNKLISKYGLYFRQGNAWNLGLYER